MTAGRHGAGAVTMYCLECGHAEYRGGDEWIENCPNCKRSYFPKKHAISTDNNQAVETPESTQTTRSTCSTEKQTAPCKCESKRIITISPQTKQERVGIIKNRISSMSTAGGPNGFVEVVDLQKLSEFLEEMVTF